MKKEEVLEKAKKKHPIGEMEQAKINKSGWISLIVVGTMAVAFMIVEGGLRQFASLYATGTLCFTWACVFYTLQYFLAKRPWQVLIGTFFEGAGAITMFVFFILYATGVM